MAENLVGQILQGLGSGATDQLSSALGIDRGATQNAMGGIVPAILAGLIGLVSRPGGGDRLSSVIAQLGNLGMPDGKIRPISQGNMQTTTEQGSSLLSSLLGGEGVTGLASGVAQYLGLSQGVAGKLLGLATPLILGALGRQAQSSGAGAGGLANMLLGQRDAVAAALPPGLASALQGSGLLSGIADRLGQGTATAARSSAGAVEQGVGAATAAASDLGTRAAQSATSYAGARPSRGGSPRWLYAVIAAVILAIGAYWLWGTGGVQEANLGGPAPAQTGGSGTSTPAGLDLARQLTGTLDKARGALQQVSDQDSAKRALPQFNDMVAQLDKLRDAAAQAPDTAKRAMVETVAKAKPGLQDLIDKVLAKPGAAEVLKPTLDAFKSKLDALAPA
jgi:hypothetical protein